MNRRQIRTVRRRYAILGVLAEWGALNATTLCTLLHHPCATLYADLAALEGDGRIVGEWVVYAPAGQPRRRLYRLPTDDERAARHARTAQTETQETR